MCDFNLAAKFQFLLFSFNNVKIILNNPANTENFKPLTFAKLRCILKLGYVCMSTCTFH